MVLDLDLPAAAAEPPAGVVDDGLRIDHVVLSEEPLPAYRARAGRRLRRPPGGRRGGLLRPGRGAACVRRQERLPVRPDRPLRAASTPRSCAAIACDALGAENVYGVSMPSKYSSDHSRDDAAELARRTGLNFRTVAIEPMFDAYMGALDLTGLAEENLQSRLRGTLLMAISNQEGQIVLAPGNKSELAVGYSTLYGDSVGAYGPIKDVYKTTVFRLARWRNRAAEDARPDSADPGELDRQAAERRTAPRPGRHGLAARLRRAGPRSWSSTSTATRARTRSSTAGFDAETGREDAADGGRGRVQAAPVPAGHQDLREGLRQGPPAADHQPLAGDPDYRRRR